MSVGGANLQYSCISAHRNDFEVQQAVQQSLLNPFILFDQRYWHYTQSLLHAHTL